MVVCNDANSSGQDHILRYVDWCEPSTTNKEVTALLVTELCGGGDLNTFINNTPAGMSPIQILRVVRQIASALEYLHGQGRFHTDVKPRNIFIRSVTNMDVVLGDCADIRATAADSRHGNLTGTPAYYSPQVHQYSRHMGPPDDVWALGVTTLGMVGQWPKVLYERRGGRDERQIQEYPRQCWEHAGKLEELNPGTGIVGLIVRMLVWEQDKRISARKLKDMAGSEMRGCEEHGELESELRIRAPTHFQPIEFW